MLDIVAHKNVRMRGQAFLSFGDKKAAAKAVEEVKGFPLYGKPMVSRASWRCAIEVEIEVLGAA